MIHGSRVILKSLKLALGFASSDAGFDYCRIPPEQCCIRAVNSMN